MIENYSKEIVKAWELDITVEDQGVLQDIYSATEEAFRKGILMGYVHPELVEEAISDSSKNTYQLFDRFKDALTESILE